MGKIIDVAYRDIDVEIPSEIQRLFDVVSPYLQISSSGVYTEGYINTSSRSSRTIPCSFAICGGLPRDLLFGKQYNDVDVVTPMYGAPSFNRMNSGLLLKEKPTHNSEHPHYDLNDPDAGLNKLLELHFITDYICTTSDPSDDVIVTPGMFDFTINEIHMNKEGRFYATPMTWFDYDNKILRINTGRSLSSNIAIRAIRFAVKYGLTVEENTLKLVMAKFNERHLNETEVYRHLGSIERDGTQDEVFRWLKVLKYPEVDLYDNFSDFKYRLAMKLATYKHIATEQLEGGGY